MSVSEKHQAIGSWELPLRVDTPRTILDRLDVRKAGFGHVVITPTPVNLEAIPDAGLLGLARYVGVYLRQADPYTMSGGGLGSWISDADGKGPAYSVSVSTAAGTFAQWAATLRPFDLSAGIVGAIAGVFNKTYYRTTVRGPLDEVCAYFGAEWRVRNTFAFDIGRPADLFNLTPKAVIVRKAGEGGRDFNILGVVGDLKVARDVEDWSRRIVYYTGTEEAPVIAVAPAAAVPDNDVPFRSPTGAVIRMDRLIEDFSTTPAGSATSLAAAQYGRFKAPRQELKLSTQQYDVGQDVRVGDNIFVFDPLAGIQNLATELEYRGRIIYPETIRCVGLSWPIRKGMGVYFRYYVKVADVWTVQWIDLTNHVDWETGDTTVEVGEKPRSS